MTELGTRAPCPRPLRASRVATAAGDVRAGRSCGQQGTHSGSSSVPRRIRPIISRPRRETSGAPTVSWRARDAPDDVPLHVRPSLYSAPVSLLTPLHLAFAASSTRHATATTWEEQAARRKSAPLPHLSSSSVRPHIPVGKRREVVGGARVGGRPQVLRSPASSNDVHVGAPARGIFDVQA